MCLCRVPHLRRSRSNPNHWFYPLSFIAAAITIQVLIFFSKAQAMHCISAPSWTASEVWAFRGSFVNTARRTLISWPQILDRVLAKATDGAQFGASAGPLFEISCLMRDMKANFEIDNSHFRRF